MWKPIIGISSHSQIAVSVPLRGLDMWKPADHPKFHPKKYCFSPLAGIRYVETRFRIILPLHPSPVSVPLRGLDMWKLGSALESVKINFIGFSPLAGIRYVETFI